MKKIYIINNGVKMRRLFFLATGILVLMMTVFPGKQLKAQVFGEFEGVQLVNRPFEFLQGGTAIPYENFVVPPNNTLDLDDGYAEVQLPFPFEFNGEVFTKVWININGFVTFGKVTINGTLEGPPTLIAGTKNSNALFFDDPSYPVNVIAPFWGDHYFRPDSVKYKGYAPTTISYKSEPDKFTIEWKNLNINYFPDFKASVADFQLILYKSTDPYSAQGDIEFRYGTVGKRAEQIPYWQTGQPGFDERLFTNNCAVGIKGEGKGFLQKADFMNALFNGGYLPYDPVKVVTDTSKTTEWTPTRNNALSIFLRAKKRFNIAEWWGDGDVDFSKAAGEPHYNKPQNRFVTINDARLVMRAIATNVPLDSIRRRAAYHADVNHNGRFYYDTLGNRKTIPWRTMNYADSMHRITDISSLKQIMFQADEYDAALIIAYISGRIPYLPWIWDTVPQYGKVNNEIASIRFGEWTRINENTYNIPVYLDANFAGPVGAKFQLDGEVVSVTTNDENIIAVNGKNTVVISGVSEFAANKPFAYVTVTTNNNEINASNIRFNERELESIKIKLAEGIAGEEFIMTAYPNPANSTTNIAVSIEKSSNYELAIFDAQGNLVKVLHKGSLKAGQHSFDWNLTDEAGKKVGNGVYIYRLTGNGNTVSNKVVISR